MSVPRVHLFGQFQLEIGGQIIRALDPHKAEELLCYLLLNRRGQHHRESLAELLCDECEASLAKKRLRQILWRLQSLPASAGQPDAAPLLLAERDWVQLNPQSRPWSDVQLFERACVLVENLRGEELTPEQADVLRHAAGLYRDDLLVGWYQDWCLWERERLQNLYLELLDKLMGHCEAQQQYDSGLAFGEEMLRFDRTSERTYQRLMRLHARADAARAGPPAI